MDFESTSREKKRPTTENEEDDKDMAMGLEALSRVKKGKGEELSDFMQKRLDDIKDKTPDGNIEEMIKNDPERSNDWADLNKGLGQLEEIKREKKETARMQKEDYEESLEKIKKLQQETGMDLSQAITELEEKVKIIEEDSAEDSIKDIKSDKKEAAEGGEKTKTCAKCGREILLGANFCVRCGNKLEKGEEIKPGNEKKEQEKIETEEEKMMKEGKEIEDTLKPGEVFNINVVMNAGKDIVMNFNPKENDIEFMVDGKKTRLTAGEVIGLGFILENSTEQKYLSVFDGKLIISDLEYQKKAADDYVKNNPSRLENFKKTIQSLVDQKKPIPPLFQHINEKYFQKKDGVSKEEAKQQNNRGVESVLNNNMEDEGDKEHKLEGEKKEASNDFLKTLKSFEILHGEIEKKKKEKMVDETLEEIRTATDNDYVDLALAKGIKNARRIFAEMKKEK